MLKVRTQKSGDTVIFRLRGWVVTGETATLRMAVLSRLDAAVLVLDLARVSRIDARGLGVMLELREQLQSRGIEFRLMNVNRLVRQVLEIARLDSVFEVSSEAEVLSEGERGQQDAETETPSYA